MSKLEGSALESPGHDSSSGNPDHPGENQPPLLAADEPLPCEILNAGAAAQIIVVCDHAGNRIPRSLNNLGLDEFSMRRHIAWDIGAGDVARFLAPGLGAPAVLANYSRLVVDCNRKLDDATAFRALSDGDEVPGNHLLTATEKRRRAEAIYSIHSFTPFFDNSHRPWEIGVLWDNDPRIAVPLMENLRDKGWNVGDNEPYSGRHPHDFTVDYHGEKRGLPHASIEIRQDLLRDATARRQWAATLADCLKPILEQEELYRFFSGKESAR